MIELTSNQRYVNYHHNDIPFHSSRLQNLTNLTVLSGDGTVEYWELLHKATPRVCGPLNNTYIFRNYKYIDD